MRRTLISGASLLTMEPHAEAFVGELLIEDGKIAALGPSLEVSDADVIEARGKIVMPGLVDTHRHLWQGALRGIAAEWTLTEYLAGVVGGYGSAFIPEDVYVGDLLGAREALNAGVTTVLDFNQVIASPEHADAAIAGLRESGVRAVFAPNLPRWTFPDTAAISRMEQGIRHIEDVTRGLGDLVHLALGVRPPETSSIDVTEQEMRLARRLGLRMAMHAGMGASGGAAHSIAQIAERGLAGDDTMYIHCCTSTDEELQVVADTGGGVSVSPRVEMLMGHGEPVTGRALERGIVPSLSVDVVTAVVGSLFADVRAALEAETCRQHRACLERGETLGHRSFSAQRALEWATIEGARTLGMDGRIGSLTVGKDADVLVLDVDTPEFRPLNDVAAAASQCGPGNVEHVFVRGVPRKTDFSLVGVDAAADAGLGALSRDRLVAAVRARTSGT